MDIRSSAYYFGLCKALAVYGLDPKKVENPWGENGILFHFTYQGSVTVLVGLYQDTTTNRPFVTLETGLGHVREKNRQPVLEYCAANAYNFAFPARFCLKDEGEDGTSLLVLNYRSCAFMINPDYVSELLDSMLGVSVIEARNLMELGLQPWAHKQVA